MTSRGAAVKKISLTSTRDPFLAYHAGLDLPVLALASVDQDGARQAIALVQLESSSGLPVSTPIFMDPAAAPARPVVAPAHNGFGVAWEHTSDAGTREVYFTRVVCLP